MKKKAFLSIFFLLSISFFLLVSLFILFAFLCYIPNYGTSHRRIQRQQVMEINFRTNHTKYGTSNSIQFLKNDEFRTYRNERTGNFVILSPFGGTRYRCTGSCYCNNNNQRRTTTSSSSLRLLSKGLTFLITALSTSVALRMAKETFKEECVQRFASEEEEGCKSEKDIELDDVECDTENWIDEDKGRYIGFECEGFCIKNVDLKLSIWKFHQRKFGDCTRLVERGTVDVFNHNSENVAISEELLTKLAKKEFSWIHLNSFCKDMSSVRVNDDYEELPIPMCVHMHENTGEWHNIECRSTGEVKGVYTYDSDIFN